MTVALQRLSLEQQDLRYGSNHSSTSQMPEHTTYPGRDDSIIIPVQEQTAIQLRGWGKKYLGLNLPEMQTYLTLS